jgi:hypothetical protein
MNTRIFFSYHNQLPAEQSDILLYLKGDDFPHLLYVGYGGRLSCFETELQKQLDEGREAVYCYVEELASLAFEIAEQN